MIRAGISKLHGRCAVVAAAILSLFLSIPTVDQAAGTERSKRVLFLHSYNYTLPGTTLITEGARDRLAKSGKSIEVDAVYLDAAKIAIWNRRPLWLASFGTDTLVASQM